jgi:hypothetical protein
MASLLNNASLLLNPAGSIIAYEEDKIFSVLPSNGTGDFTFSGGDGGTRVNPEGYVEIVPWNLSPNSDITTLAGYSVGPNMVDLGIVTGPDGKQSARRFRSLAPSNAYVLSPNFNLPSTGIYTFSMWVRVNAGTATNTPVVYNGVGASVTMNTTPTSTWQRVYGTVSVPGGNTTPTIPFYDSANGVEIEYAYIQINPGTLKPYIPVTDRLNYPRITYQNGRGALLSEPQRTNNCNYSQQIDNNNWTYSNVSITANDTISPDGTQNADRVTRSSTSSTYFYNSNTLASSNRANSMFLKKGTIDQVTILGNGYSAGTFATFNLSNGTILSSAGCTPFIEQYKDGWYRCGFVQTNGVNYYLLVTLNGYNNETVTSGEYLYAWGGQSELGEFPTSYIPTTSATVTRPQDNANKTGISSLIGQTEGVMYLDYTVTNQNANTLFTLANSIGANSYLNSFYFLVIPNSLFVCDGFASGTVQFSFYNSPLSNGRHKIALAYKANDFALFIDGVLKNTDNSGTVPPLSAIEFNGVDGGTSYQNLFNTTALFNTRLTNTQLAELTTVRSGSGGNISYYGPYTIHTFTGSATFTPSFTGPVEVLVVAGGGGGGYDNGGGGGAGGLLYVSSYGVSQGTGITVTIGAGGVGGPNGYTKGTNGGNSVFGGLTALGGGGGASDVNTLGLNGGSGGGSARTGGTGAKGLGTPGQGNDGGNSPTSPVVVNGGGGGGAGQVGETSSTANKGGNGGNGLPYSISGFSTYYAGGGGGGSASSEARTNGGLGGGGFGSQGNVYNPTTGTNYLGGGGGGGPGSTSPRDGKNGGDGIVILRYLT